MLSAMNKVQYAECKVQSAVYNVQNALCRGQCAKHNVQSSICADFIVRSEMSKLK